MRLAVMGTPDFAVPALRGLHAAGHDIAAVYCQPPRPAGRGQAVRKCPMHLAAEALGLPVRTPARLRRDAGEHAAFAALGLDAAVPLGDGGCVLANYGRHEVPLGDGAIEPADATGLADGIDVGDGGGEQVSGSDGGGGGGASQ